MKKIKMVMYGTSGTGKTVFATSAPNFYAITADANYDWVEDFGMTPDRYTQVTSWTEFKKALDTINYDNYETIVIDSFEKVYDWAGQEFCREKKVETIGDYKSMGAGYNEILKRVAPVMEHLFQRDKNILVILHETESNDKDTRRGRELAKHRPNLNEKMLLSLASNSSLVVRAYCETQMDANGNTIEHRYIGLAPDNVNEYGFVRGLADDRPFEIPLDWNALAETMMKYPVKPVRYTPGQEYMSSLEVKKANTNAKQEAIRAKVVAKTATNVEIKTEPKAEIKAKEPAIEPQVDNSVNKNAEMAKTAPSEAVKEKSEIDRAREVVAEKAFDASLSPEAYGQALEEAYPNVKNVYKEKPQPTATSANGISPEKQAQIDAVRAKLKAMGKIK